MIVHTMTQLLEGSPSDKTVGHLLTLNCCQAGVVLSLSRAGHRGGGFVVNWQEMVGEAEGAALVTVHDGCGGAGPSELHSSIVHDLPADGQVQAAE